MPGVGDHLDVTKPDPVLSDRFVRAAELAVELHAKQARKGTRIPYVAHLLAVAALVLEDGGSEDEAIAALLHDAVEDQGGPRTAERIRTEFGRHVAAIVEGCSDTDEVPKPPWKQRKHDYLAHLESADSETLRVSLADKLHNLRSIDRDYAEQGEGLWDRFSASREETLWYYASLAEVFARRSPGPMSQELSRLAAALTAQVGGRPTEDPA